MKLSDIVEIKIGLPLSRKKGEKYKYKLLTLKCFDKRGIYIDEECLENFSASEKVDNYLTKANDVVVRLREPIKAVYITKEILIPSTMAILRAKKDIDMKFLAYYLNTKKVQKEFHKNIEGSYIRMVGGKDIKEIDINLPSKDIQHKVVDILDLQEKELSLYEELINQKELLKETILRSVL
ncbi:restriction endonuclease subunit S [Nautilia sp.]